MFISIVVSFYNQENYVKRCLDSILNQNCLDEVEVICVDDASSDNTLSLLRNYEAQYDHLHVISLDENSSLHMTRIMGMRMAKGDALMFVDGDDELKPDAIEVLKNEMRKDPVDILQFGVEIVDEKEKVPDAARKNLENWVKPYEEKMVGREVFEKCFISMEYCHNAWGKLYDMELIKRACTFMEDIPLYTCEDKYEYFIIADMATSFRGIKDKLYRYYVGEGVSTKQSISEKEFEKVCLSADVVHADKRYATKKNIDKYTEALRIFETGTVRDSVYRGYHCLDGGFEKAISSLLKHFDAASIFYEFEQMIRADMRADEDKPLEEAENESVSQIESGLITKLFCDKEKITKESFLDILCKFKEHLTDNKQCCLIIDMSKIAPEDEIPLRKMAAEEGVATSIIFK